MMKLDNSAMALSRLSLSKHGTSNFGSLNCPSVILVGALSRSDSLHFSREWPAACGASRHGR